MQTQMTYSVLQIVGGAFVLWLLLLILDFLVCVFWDRVFYVVLSILESAM